MEPRQPPAFRLFGFVYFFALPPPFFFFFRLIVLIKSFCPVLFFTGLTMRPSARRFLCFSRRRPPPGPASCCEPSPWRPAAGGLRGGAGGGVRGDVTGEQAPGWGLRAAGGALLRADSRRREECPRIPAEVNKVASALGSCLPDPGPPGPGAARDCRTQPARTGGRAGPGRAGRGLAAPTTTRPGDTLTLS